MMSLRPMISLRRARTMALVPILGAGALISTAAAPQTAGTDFFTYRAGARIVAMPADADIAEMSSSPFNLIDESASTDWTGEAGQAVFVLELSEETELSRIAFDTAGLNRDRKAPRGFTVALSNTSANSGFEEVLSGELRMNANGQSFAFKPEDRPTGRWVRLTIESNHGDDYTGLTGFHGYGRQTTASASTPDLTGNYDGASGWGWIHLKQEGDRVAGCYEYQRGEFTGTVDGRVLKLDIVDTSSDESKTRLTGIFQLTPDGRGIVGLVRGVDRASRDSYAAYYSARKVGRSAGGC